MLHRCLLYTSNLAGSRYFIEQAPLHSYDELDRRMRDGELAVAIEILQKRLILF